ncbi:MAG TPA: hypothetical protein VF488_01135 [Gemmatimonadaceae bacterium]
MTELVANQDRSFLRRVAFWGGLLTWILLCATFVGLLGGTHPSDASRDCILGAAAGLIAVLSLPSAVLLARRIRRRETARAILVPALALLARIAAAAWVLWSVHGISHEHGP